MIENMISVMMAVLVGGLGALILYHTIVYILFYRNLSVIENMISVVMTVLVGGLCALILYHTIIKLFISIFTETCL